MTHAIVTWFPVCTVAVIIDVCSSSRLMVWPAPVASSRILRVSVMPPVMSARPSNVVPYFRASYEPCNLAGGAHRVSYGIHLAMSARPSNVVPYFRASYEPCNLTGRCTQSDGAHGGAAIATPHPSRTTRQMDTLRPGMYSRGQK